MADSGTQRDGRCPDTGQSKSEEGEVSSASGDSTNGTTIPMKSAPFQGVKPAKFVPVPGINPFAPRPVLKTDSVSTSTSCAPSPAKFVLRPSALSAHPVNQKNEVTEDLLGSGPTLLKPAKLPDPTKPSPKDAEDTEKENTEESSLLTSPERPTSATSPPPSNATPAPSNEALPTADAAPEVSESTSADSSHENLFQSALREHEKRVPEPVASNSSNTTSSSSNSQVVDGDKILGENLTEKVTGVHTSPKGAVSSTGFVFGENLAERVQINQSENKTDDNGVASPDSTDQSDHSAPEVKTLEESAREYQASHDKKPELQEVEVVTGEENESNVLQTNGKLFVFDGETQNWVERGRGLLRLNDMRCLSSQTFQSRLLMRTQGSLRLILNTKVWPGMTVERASQKSVRLTGTDGDNVKVFLLNSNLKDTETLLRALDWRIQQLRVQEEQHRGDSNTSTSEKRKADLESPTEEFVVKKAKKSDDEGTVSSFRREESDSSVIDPETEVSSESHASSFTLRTDSD